MDDLVAAMSSPQAYPHRVDTVERRETHISWVFLAGPFAYKVKKPVDLGFVDYSTLERRRWFCGEEVRLNQRFAPGVYLGVVPVDQQLRVEGTAGVREWAVKMRRLPEEATVRAQSEVLTVDGIERVGRHLAALHRASPGGPEAIAHASAASVAVNVRENFSQTAAHVGSLVPRAVWSAVRAHSEAALAALGPTLDARSPRAIDAHGDLRAEHVLLIDGGVVVIDCVEFSSRLRCADPASDLAFLAMDLAVVGRWDLADALVAAWIEATGDAGAAEVIPFYAAYRSVVRAKVRGLQGDGARASRHWLLALALLAPRGEEPRLVGIGGLPGTGKSTLARELGLREHFEVLRSDVVRKELAGVDPRVPAGRAADEQGRYSPEAKEQVYAECLRRAEGILRVGGRVVIDATFARESWRGALLDLGRTCGVPAALVWCEAPAEVVEPRLAARVDDASDADLEVYRAAARDWEPESVRTVRHLVRVDASAPVEDVVRAAARALDDVPCGALRGPPRP